MSTFEIIYLTSLWIYILAGLNASLGDTKSNLYVKEIIYLSNHQLVGTCNSTWLPSCWARRLRRGSLRCRSH